MNAPALRAVGVGLTYGARAALHDVGVCIRPGELVALIGPNGAGKSTLLSVLAGDAPEATGSVSLDDREVGAFRPTELARRRSVLTQSNEVSFPFTVEEVVAMGRAPWPASDDDEAHVARALADAEVADFRERRMPHLSGGERARVAYARVRAQGCDLMLLDEPTASLDIRHQERLLAQLLAHSRAGGSVVVVLHDLNLAAAYADRVVLLERGRVVADGPPASALTSAVLSDVYRHPIRVGVDGEGRITITPERSRPSITDRKDSDA